MSESDHICCWVEKVHSLNQLNLQSNESWLLLIYDIQCDLKCLTSVPPSLWRVIRPALLHLSEFMWKILPHCFCHITNNCWWPSATQRLACPYVLHVLQMMYLKITSCCDSASFTYLFLGLFCFRLIFVSSLKYGRSVCSVKSGPSSFLFLRTMCERSVFFHVSSL